MLEAVGTGRRENEAGGAEGVGETDGKVPGRIAHFTNQESPQRSGHPAAHSGGGGGATLGGVPCEEGHGSSGRSDDWFGRAAACWWCGLEDQLTFRPGHRD